MTPCTASSSGGDSSTERMRAVSRPRRAEVERDAVDGVRMPVAVPVARAQTQRRADRDVVDDELGRDDRGERCEREGELFEPVDDVSSGSCDATRDAVAVAASRRSCSECVTLANPCATWSATRSKKPSGEPRSAFDSPATSTPRVTPSPTSG